MTVFTIETSRRDLIAALADAVAGGAVPFVILWKAGQFGTGPKAFFASRNMGYWKQFEDRRGRAQRPGQSIRIQAGRSL
jgi:hypothetical protein